MQVHDRFPPVHDAGVGPAPLGIDFCRLTGLSRWTEGEWAWSGYSIVGHGDGDRDGKGDGDGGAGDGAGAG